LDNLSTGRLSNLNQIKNKIKFINIDISSKKKSIKKYFKKIDWVFHLAGIADIVPSITNPNSYFKTNVKGTLNILEVSKKAKVKKLIYAASASCYGIPKKYPTNEKTEIDPQYPYALTKLIGEQLVIHWAKIYNMPNISLRFFNAYGPRSRTTGAYGAVFGVFLAQKLAKKPLTIVGDGNQTRDFIHVSDLVDAMIKSAKKGKIGEIYNVGGGKEVTVNKIAKLIGGRRFYIPKRPGEPDRSLADITKIKRSLNWRPKIKIEEGIKNLLNNINYWKDAPVWNPKSIKKATKSWFDLLG
jgi:UDP-glucose 4-epimerase